MRAVVVAYIVLAPFAVFAVLRFGVWWLAAPFVIVGTLFWVAAGVYLYEHGRSQR
jgi:hypothetical protein